MPAQQPPRRLLTYFRRLAIYLAMAIALLGPLAAGSAFAEHRDDWTAPVLWVDDTAGCALSTVVTSPCVFVVYHAGSGVTPDVVHLTWEETAGGHKSSQMEIPFYNGAPDADNEYFLGDLRDNDTYTFRVQYCVKHTFSSDDCSNWGSLPVFTFDGSCPPVGIQDVCYNQKTSSGLVAVSTVPQSAAAPAPAPAVPSLPIAVVAPSLSLSVPTVTAGNTVTVNGQAFTYSGDSVLLTLTSDGVPIIDLGTATVSQGGFSMPETIPANTGPGSYQVHAQGSGAKADASLQVTAPGGKQTLSVTDSSGAAATPISSDTQYTLTGTNFAPGIGVTVFLDSKTGPQLGTATAGQQSESFTMTLDVTAAQIGNKNGNHTLVVVSLGSVVAQVTLPFVVLQGPH